MRWQRGYWVSCELLSDQITFDRLLFKSLTTKELSAVCPGNFLRFQDGFSYRTKILEHHQLSGR